MDHKMKAILDSTPDSPTRSKLEPYRELIRGLRLKHKTFLEIARILRTNYNLEIHPSNIHRFIKVRSRQQQLKYETPPPEPSPQQDPEPSHPVQSSADTAPVVFNAEIYDRIEALKKRSRQPKPRDKPVFEYTEGTPLTLIPQPRKD